MKSILSAILSFPLLAMAQTGEPETIMKPVICADAEQVIRHLAGEKYREVPIWTGRDNETLSSYSVFVNDRTGTWTIIQFDNKTACILGAGQRSQRLESEPAV